MDINELNYFGDRLEKNAFVGKVLKKMLFKKKKPPFKKRMESIGKSIFGTSMIVGGLGVGGVAYGAIKQPGSIRSNNSRFKY